MALAFLSTSAGVNVKKHHKRVVKEALPFTCDSHITGNCTLRTDTLKLALTSVLQEVHIEEK